MSVADGFATADIDTALMDDTKIVALARALRNDGADEGLIWTAIGMFVSLTLRSWREGERITLEEAQPAWSFVPLGAVASLLVTHRLIGDDHRLLDESWMKWAGTALDRLQRQREGGQKGAARRWGSGQTIGDPKVAQGSPIGSRASGPGRAGPGTPSTTTKSNGATSSPAPALAREGLPNITPAIAAEWEAATGRSLLASGVFAQDYVDDAARRHPGPSVLEAIRVGRQTFPVIPTPQQLTVAVRGVLDPLPSSPRGPAESPDMKAAREMAERQAEREAARARGAAQ